MVIQQTRLRFWLPLNVIHAVAVLLAAWLFGCTAFQFHPRTPLGTQCPTAPVQSVAIVQRDCCGNVIGARFEAPKPGSKYFIQCHCQERKEGRLISTAPPRLEPFFVEVFRWQAIELPSVVVRSLPYQEQVLSHTYPPLLRPPAAAV